MFKKLRDLYSDAVRQGTRAGVAKGKKRVYWLGLGVYGVLLFFGLNIHLLWSHSEMPIRLRVVHLVISFIICEIAGFFCSRTVWSRLQRLSR